MITTNNNVAITNIKFSEKLNFLLINSFIFSQNKTIKKTITAIIVNLII